MLSNLFISDRMAALCDNPLASFIEDYFVKENELPSLALLRNWNWVEKGKGRVAYDSTLRSMRIIALMLKGIRKYGVNRITDYYGLELSDRKKRTCSLILMGSNGVGKSTWYAALEKLGKGSSNLVKLKGYNTPEEEQSYFVHDNMNHEDCVIKLVMENKKILEGNLKGLWRSRIPEACFCSDYDVELLEKTDNFNDFIRRQTGIDSLDNLLSLTEEYLKYLDAQRAGGMSDLTNEVFDFRYSKATELREIIQLEINDIIKDLYPKIKDIGEKILQKHFSMDAGETLRMDIDGTNFSCRVVFGNGTPELSKSPRQYLNTFRFKLFVFSLKLALGACMKIYNNIDCPFIVDDMFDSSDFDNRKDIGEYFSTFIKIHDEVIKSFADGIEAKAEKKDAETRERAARRAAHIRKMTCPQIIFFTQDELIADSIYSRLEDLQRIIKGRLFEPDDTTARDIRRLELPGPAGREHCTVMLAYSNVYDVVQKSID